MKIIFMGTPAFAVPALEKLQHDGHDIVLTVTQPDRPCGRGQQLAAPPVKAAALALKLSVSQPDSIRTAEFGRALRALQPEVIVVVAFGQILPRGLLSVPPLGAVNIHASLLPKFRGPAPIQWAIINQEKQTGVTTMLLDEGLDTGDILLTEKTDILPDDTAADLHDRLAALGAGLLGETLRRLARGDIRPVPQDHAAASYAPLLKKNDGRINWQQTACALDAFIRGMSPWPGAFTFLDRKRLKIFRAKALAAESREAPGKVIQGFSGELRVMTGSGALSILELQGASGKRMPVRDFLRGNPVPLGSILN